MKELWEKAWTAFFITLFLILDSKEIFRVALEEIKNPLL